MQSSSQIKKQPEINVPDRVPKMIPQIIFAVALAHLLNDLIQAALPAI